MTDTATTWQNRIIGSGTERPDQLLANPMNFRLHPKVQQEALEAILREVGWVQDVIVNRTTGHILDGHLRVELALRKNQEVPIKYIEVSEAEEKLLLVSFDPISAMATQDNETLNSLMRNIIETTDYADILGTIHDLPDLEGDQRDEARKSLVERFLAPPFSVLDTKQGYWRNRKEKWLALGIKSEVGRDDCLTYAESSQPPEVYEFKNDIEKKLGRKMSWEEFAEQYPEKIRLTGTSIFDPVLCEIAYSWFAPAGAEILDPFAGGSVRGIVAGWLGHQYTGIELRKEQVEANRDNWADILTMSADPGTAHWINADSRMMDDHLDTGQQFDLIFSCPPYADLEVYSNDPADISTMDYPAFLEAYRDIIAKAARRLKPNRFAVWVVGEVRGKDGRYLGFVQDTIKAFEDAGLRYYNEVVLLTAIGSNAIRASGMFTTSRKLAKGHQNVLVFSSDSEEKAAKALFKAKKQVTPSHETIIVFSNGSEKEAAAEFGEPKNIDLEAIALESMES